MMMSPAPQTHPLTLAGKLQTVNLTTMSIKMQEHNQKTIQALKDQWQAIFRQIFKGQVPAALDPRVQEMDFDRALKAGYGLTLAGCNNQTSTQG